MLIFDFYFKIGWFIFNEETGKLRFREGGKGLLFFFCVSFRVLFLFYIGFIFRGVELFICLFKISLVY